GRTYRVQYLDSLSEPNWLGPAEGLPNPGELSVPLRAIYVRQASLADSLSRLVEFRGPGILELEPQAAYNTYNGGQQSSQAIRSALIEILGAAPETIPLPTVLIVGHASYDRRNLMNQQVFPQIPGVVELGTAFLDQFGRFVQTEIMT